MPLDLALWLILIISNYPCLKHIFMVPKVFEPFSFYSIYFTIIIFKSDDIKMIINKFKQLRILNELRKILHIFWCIYIMNCNMIGLEKAYLIVTLRSEFSYCSKTGNALATF